MNSAIRNYLVMYVAVNGPTRTQALVRDTALHFSVNRHCVSGNLSYVVCRANSLSIVKSRNGNFVY